MRKNNIRQIRFCTKYLLIETKTRQGLKGKARRLV
jgi:hypothetical protein